MLKNHPIPPSQCPHCKKLFDMAMGAARDLPPRPGDIAICTKCTGLLRYNKSLKLVRLVGIRKLPPHQQEVIREIRKVIKTANSQSKSQFLFHH